VLKVLFPRVHRRFSSLPVLGSIADGFGAFLINNGYPRTPTCRHVRTLLDLDRRLRRRGVKSLSELKRSHLRACCPPAGRSQDNINLASAGRLLERYLDTLNVFGDQRSPTAIESALAEYAAYLRDMRGLAPSTIRQHGITVDEFLTMRRKRKRSHLRSINSSDLEYFVTQAGRRVSRASLQHMVAHLRSFLRFLAARGEALSGLDSQIDTPLVYRDEKLPRSLPWETVCALLNTVDRTSPLGRRDYAILLLIITYGLRSSDIVALRIEDIQWRSRKLRVSQIKTAVALWLPLTDSVGNAVMDYLRHGRPAVPHRELFVRHRAPAGVLKATAVTDIFQARSERSGLPIPFHGAHLWPTFLGIDRRFERR
jgi:integrase/recombinase XerD